MKKTLLLIILILLGNNIIAQILLAEDSSTLVVGNIGTDIAGTNAGQGGWYTRTLAPLNGNANFQIANVGGIYGNAIQITGFSGANVATPTPETTNSRFLYKSIATEWANRDFGAEITEIECDFFTGPATTSSNIMRISIYDGPNNATATKVLAAIIIPMSTLTIRGVLYFDPTTVAGGTGAVGPYSIALGSDNANPPIFSDITLARNTWYRFGISYNTTTGEVKYKGAGISRNSVQGAAAGSSVDNFTLIATTGGTATAPNSGSAIGTFDNIVVRATSTDTLLAVDSIVLTEDTFSISPNPANEIIKISNNMNININSISITDLNGRIVKTEKVSNVANIEINVSDLTTGMYLMNINSDKGIVTKKIMKK